MVIIISLLTNNILKAQTPIQYSYDNSGNRILRKVITLKSAKVLPDSTNISKKGKDIYEDNLGNKKIIIYPNPTKGELRVDIGNYEDTPVSGLSIYDISGKLIIKKSQVNQSTILDLFPYPSGTYVMIIYIGNEKAEWKILKE